MKSIVFCLVLFLCISFVAADVCTGVAAGSSTCNALWFSCVNNGATALDTLGVLFGQQQSSIAPWVVGTSGWPQTPLPGNGQAPVYTTRPFYLNGVETQPVGATYRVGQGQWACTGDAAFTYTASVSAYGCGCTPTYDLWARSGSVPWPYLGLHSRTFGGSDSYYNTPSLTLINNLVPPSNQYPGSSGTLAQLKSAMYALGTVGGNVECFLSSFDPCTQNACPPGQQRAGAGSSCCPTGQIITYPEPVTCCPSGQTPVVVPNTSPQEKICCPTGQVAMADRTCCPAANYVNFGTGDICCPIANPVCQFTWTSGCQLKNPDGTYARCCPANRANNDQTTCCPTAVVGCDLRKRVDCTLGYQNTPNNDCCEPLLTSNGGRFCCPAKAPAGETLVTTTSPYGLGGGAGTNTDCCPSGQVTGTGTNSYCCPNTPVDCRTVAGGCVQTNLAWDGQSQTRLCCPAPRRSVYKNASGQTYCCPNNPGAGLVWYRTTNNECCPSDQISGSGTTAYCCPAGGPYVVVLAAATPDELNCCPTARASSGNRYCCPLNGSGQNCQQLGGCVRATGGCAANTCLGNNNECCPSNKLVVDYCCPTSAGTTRTYTCDASFAGTDACYCCPSGQVSLQTGGSPSTAYCCPNAGATLIWTTNNPCCPNAARVTGTNANAYCCPSAPPSGQTLVAVTSCATLCPGLGAGLCPYTCGDIKCCPSEQVSSNGGSTKYCCPPSTPPPTGGYRIASDDQCCPADRWDSQTAPCCLAAKVATNECTATGCTSFSTGVLHCCPGASGTLWWTTSNNGTPQSECCPEANTAWSNIPRNRRSSTCCPTSVVNPIFTATNPCCPLLNLAKCGPSVACTGTLSSSCYFWDTGSSAAQTQPLCCPGGNSLYATRRAGSLPGQGSVTDCRASWVGSSGWTGLTACAAATDSCCPAANAIVLNANGGASSTTCTTDAGSTSSCENSASGGCQGIYCCPSAVNQATTVFAWSPTGSQYVCCPQQYVSNFPANTNNYDPRSIYCCYPQTNAVFTTSNPCCLAANALTDGSFCCPNDCSAWGCAPNRNQIVNGQCCDELYATQNPNNNQWFCCPGSGGTEQLVWTANNQCCPQSQENNGYCCPAGEVYAQNLASLGLPGCCPSSAAIPIPGQTGQFWCCPSSTTFPLTNPAFATCNACPSACASGNCYNDNRYWYDIGTCARDFSGPYSYSAPSINGWSQCYQDGCCPTSRLSVDQGVCCPDSSVLPAGTTGWTSSIAPGGQRLVDLDGTWFPSGCCPTEWINLQEWTAARTGAFPEAACCPAANRVLTALSYAAQDRRCCPAAQVVRPNNWATLTNAQKSAAATGSHCCPLLYDPTRDGGSGAPVAPPGGWVWFYRDANTFCCPANNLKTAPGSVPGGPDLCCPGPAANYQYVLIGSQYQCCVASATITSPNDGQQHCCAECLATPPTLDCSGTIYWAKLLPAATNYGCCPYQPESYRLTQAGQTLTPSQIDYLAICCPQLSFRTGLSNPTGGEQGDNPCCPANQVLELSGCTTTPCWDWTKLRCCPTAVDPQNKPLWVRNWVAAGNGWADATTQNGAFGCCPPTNVNQLFGTTTNVCCPLTSDAETRESACCPTGTGVNRVLLDLNNGNAAHCCPIVVTAATYKYVPIPNTTPTQYQCCPNAYVNAENSFCCPITGANTVGSEPCCPANRANDVGTTCCPTVTTEQAVKTDDNDCCPASRVQQTGSVTLCCPAGAYTVVVPATGSPFCCPTDNVLNTGGQTVCCPQAVNVGTWSYLPVFGSQPPVTTCCPTNSTNKAALGLPGRTTCCPQDGQNYKNTDETECCPDVPTATPDGSYVACCPAAGMTVLDLGGNTYECCPTDRVVNDGSGPVCCPDARWDETTQTCCPDTDVWIVSASGSYAGCCPLTDVTTNGAVCCLSDWWSGTAVSLDTTGDCCPTAVQGGTGLCCPVVEKDYLGICCPIYNDPGFVWGDCVAANGTEVFDVCCCVFGEDCNGFCLPDPNDPQAPPPVYTLDSFDVCCPSVTLDCNGTCPIVHPNGTVEPINVEDADGTCCPPANKDCLGVCFGPDRFCCSLIGNCTTCLLTPNCGWCGNVLNGECLSGDFFGPTDNSYTNDPALCPSQEWIYSATSTIQVQEGAFGPGINPPNLEWQRQVVVLAPGDPITVEIRVRSPANIPLDLFFLQDLTQSFDDDMKNVNSTIDQFLTNIAATVPNVYYGWASFLDKPIDPYGVYVAGVAGFEDYVFRLDVPLSADPAPVAAIYNYYAGITLAGGGDVPESSLDAMLAIQDITGAVRNVGWRPDSAGLGASRVNRVALVVTDAPAHKFGDIAANISDGSCATCGALSSWNDNDNDPFQGVASRIPLTGAAIETLEGYLEKFPTQQDVADIYYANGIFPVFAVAPTMDTRYPPNSSQDDWDFMATLFPQNRALVTQIDSTSSNLEAAVITALQTITQTIDLVERTTTQGQSPFVDYSYGVNGIRPAAGNPVPAPPGAILNYTVRLIWDGKPICGSTPAAVPPYCVPQPHIITYDAIFPIQGVVFETGVVEVVVAEPASCGFCPDGIFQPWLGEACDPLDPLLVLPDGSPNPCCSQTCQWAVNEPCDVSNLCAPKYCTADGSCLPGNDTVACVNGLPDACSFNTCVPATGECVWGCRTASCCFTDNPCAVAECVDGQCSFVMSALCDCDVQNDCLTCVRTNNSCAWDVALKKCQRFNSTTVLAGYNGQKQPCAPGEAGCKPGCVGQECLDSKRAVNTTQGALKICLPGSSAANIGAIVGAVGGAACIALGVGLIALIILVLKLTGNSLGADPEGWMQTLGEGAAKDNPLFVETGHMTNPLFGDG